MLAPRCWHFAYPPPWQSHKRCWQRVSAGCRTAEPPPHAPTTPQVLRAINVTSTEALLGESEVYDTLVALQEAAANIKAKVQRIEESQKRITDVRALIDKFFVSRVVGFFFVLMDLSIVRHAYQFSLRWFSGLFREALMTCPRSNTGRERLESLTLHFASMLYGAAARSLFDEDKLPFAVLLLTRYLMAAGLCSKEESNLLLFGRTEAGRPSLARMAEGAAKKPSGNAGTPKLPRPAASPAAAPAAQSADVRPSGKEGEEGAFGGLFKGASSRSRAERQARPSGSSSQGTPGQPTPESVVAEEEADLGLSTKVCVGFSASFSSRRVAHRALQAGHTVCRTCE